MRLFYWFLETFPTPRRVRERRVRIRARREVQASEWAHRHFPNEMKRAARCVALALCEVEQIDTATFEPTSRLVKDLRMTDLEPVEMVMLLEKDFGIRIPDSDAERLETVSEWVRYIYDRAFSHAEQKEGATRGGTTRDE